MDKASVAKEIPGLIITGARYGMAERIARKVSSDKPVAVDMIGFVAADILDGAILRKFNADTPLRRVADGVVDHLSMARVAYETAKKKPESRLYLGVIAARAALVGGANALHLAKTGNRKATHIAGVVASGVAIATAVPHFKNIGKAHKDGIRKL